MGRVLIMSGHSTLNFFSLRDELKEAHAKIEFFLEERKSIRMKIEKIENFVLNKGK